MKVNSNSNISFRNIYTNKTVKKGLELAADNGSLFSAAAIAVFSTVRPLSIWVTPKTEKEDRILAISKSIVSSSIGFLLMLGLSLPISDAIKKIDEEPEKYLKKESIKKYKGKLADIYNSKSYTLGTQMFKLGLGAITAIPKAIIVASGIPVAEKLIKENFLKMNEDGQKKQKNTPVFKGKNPINNNENGLINYIAKGIGKILDKKGYQKFNEKYKNTNFPMHIIAGVDTISTATFCIQTEKSSQIREDRKQTLINNSIIGTGLSITCGYLADHVLKKPTEKFILKYKKYNKNDKNLSKQVQGIRIAKPILILGSIYYILIPLISTFLADKTFQNKNITKTS